MHRVPLGTAAVLAFSTRLHVTCVTLLQGFRIKLPECSLQSIKSKETREVKTFSTKTSQDVGMVPSVSKEDVCLHEKSTGGKTSGTRRGTIPCSTIQVDILRHRRHSGYVFTIPTSGNILMRLLLLFFPYHQANYCHWLIVTLL